MGQDGHDFGSRVVPSGFSDLGFDVDVGPLFSTPGEVDDLDDDSDVHVIGVLSQASRRLSLFTALREELIMRSRRTRKRGWWEEEGGADEGGGGGNRRTKIWWWWQVGHANPGSRFSPGKRREKRHQREQVLQSYIWSRYLRYRRRHRSDASHSWQEGRGEMMICIWSPTSTSNSTLIETFNSKLWNKNENRAWRMYIGDISYGLGT